MRITLKSTMAGPLGVHYAGDVVEMADDDARWLIRTGSAEPVVDEDTASVEWNGITAPETAMLSLPETRRRGRPRGH